MGKSLKLYSLCHIGGVFNVSISRAHYDINSTDRNVMIKACDA